jgi:hypothetical protein
VSTQKIDAVERSAFGDELRGIWRKQRLKRMGIFSLFMIFGVVGLIVLTLISSHSSFRQSFSSGQEAFLYHLIGAPQSIMDLLAKGAVLVCFVIGLFGVLADFGKLLAGPPKASKSPERTIRQFFDACLVAAGSLNRSAVDVGALAFLTPETVAAAGGWDGFNKYWTAKNKEIVDALLKKQPFEQSRFSVTSVRKVAGDDREQRYMVTVEFSGKSGDGTVGRPVRSFGPWPYRLECSVTQRDGRWYLTSGEWNGSPETSQTSPG